MNLFQFLQKAAVGDEVEMPTEPIHQQLRRGYARYCAPDSLLSERNAFVNLWIEMAGPMIAALDAAERTLNSIGDELSKAGCYDGTEPPIACVKRVIKERNTARSLAASTIADFQVGVMDRLAKLEAAASEATQ